MDDVSALASLLRKLGSPSSEPRLKAAVRALSEAVLANPELVSPQGYTGSTSSPEAVGTLRAEILRHCVQAKVGPEPATLLRTLLRIPDVQASGEKAGLASGGNDGDPGLELLAEMAHDLRSPLTSILTLADALRRGQSGPVSDVQRRQLGLIYSAALGLSATANNMTELYQAGRFVAEERGPISIRELLESVRNVLQPMAEEKGLETRLVSTTSDHRSGFGLALGRVLLNLTTNGLKFTDQGFVEIAARPRGTVRVEFSVRDTGPGIDPGAMETLFEPFRRSSGRRSYCFSGTGLGLAICRKLVEAMGSSLEVESRANWGTRFSFVVDLPPIRSARLL